MNALVLLADGFEDIEAVTAVDVLRRGGVETTTASTGSSTSVESAHGIPIAADAMFADVAGDDWDAIILPGGGKCAESLRGNDAVIKRLQRQKDEGRLICAICASPLVLEEAGVIEPDQHVTCYPSCALDMNRQTANVPVVADGQLVTGQAPGSALLFALVVLQTLAGEQVARKVARQMVTDVLDE